MHNASQPTATGINLFHLLTGMLVLSTTSGAILLALRLLLH